MYLAKQIAERKPSIFVWDISVNNNTNTLFETLTGGKQNHIFRGASKTDADLLQFLSDYVIPEFYPISCESSYPSSTVISTNPPLTTNSISTPSLPPSTNASCVSLELIFVLDRSQSIVPSIYDKNVTQFVLDFANQFSFPEEASNGNGYARFGLIQFSDTSEVTIPLGNYSRSNFNSLVTNNVHMGNDGINNIVE